MTITREWEGAAGLEQEQEADQNFPVPIPVRIVRTEAEITSPAKASCMTWPINTFANMPAAGLTPICPHRYHRYKAKLWCVPGAGATAVVLNTKRDPLAQSSPQGATFTFPTTPVPFALPDYEAEEALYAMSIGGPVTIAVIDQGYSNVQ